MRRRDDQTINVCSRGVACVLTIISVVVLPITLFHQPLVVSIQLPDVAAGEVRAVRTATVSNMTAPVELSMKVRMPKRVVLNAMREGMSVWPEAVRRLSLVAATTGHRITIPCLSRGSRVVPCQGLKQDIPLTDTFNLSEWDLVPFDAKLDLQPEVTFCMDAMSRPECFGIPQAPRSMRQWQHVAVPFDQIAITMLSREWFTVDFPTVPGGSHERFTDSFPQFAFSNAVEKEASDVLAANGLVPSSKDHAGNYVVYQWRAEGVPGIDHARCAANLSAHVAARFGSSGMKLILASEMPFDTQVLPTLWGTGSNEHSGSESFIAAREMLKSVGFMKIETMGPKAGMDLGKVPLAHLSAWDAIFARGAAALILCRERQCKPCSRTTSSYMSLLKGHFIHHHGNDSNLEYSWMQTRN